MCVCVCVRAARNLNLFTSCSIDTILKSKTQRRRRAENRKEMTVVPLEHTSRKFETGIAIFVIGIIELFNI